MSEAWFCERVEEGWEIRDRARELVALVPDEFHEQSVHADLILAAPRLAERYARLTDVLRSRCEKLEQESEASRSRVRELVEQVARAAIMLKVSIHNLRRGEACAQELAALIQDLTNEQRTVRSVHEQLNVLRAALKNGIVSG